MKITCKSAFNWQCPDKKMLYCNKGDVIEVESNVASALILSNLAVAVNKRELKLENKELAIKENKKASEIVKESKKVKPKKNKE